MNPIIKWYKLHKLKKEKIGMIKKKKELISLWESGKSPSDMSRQWALLQGENARIDEQMRKLEYE